VWSSKGCSQFGWCSIGDPFKPSRSLYKASYSLSVHGTVPSILCHECTWPASFFRRGSATLE
jgi:hypothetical protein